MANLDISIWAGRNDMPDEGARAMRWHQRVKPLSAATVPGVALIGFACDEGVRRNLGRIGAAEAPRCLRKALANLAWHQQHPVYDAGDVRCIGDQLEIAQDQLAECVAAAINAGHRPLVLGGGHETAWGTTQGLLQARPEATIGIINVDSHFDLRKSSRPNSGTAFAQVADIFGTTSRPFHYLCLGIARNGNTAALFERADSLGTVFIEDADIAPWHMEKSVQAIQSLAAAVDALYLSIDLDVLMASQMPAVSAPAIRGISLEAVEQIIDCVVATGRLSAVDIVEFNPKYDPDGRAARCAAGLIWRIAQAWV